MDDEFVLAINGDWDALLAALRENRTLAHQTDANGMTLLHWVCLHQDIPTEVLIKIVFANPHAVNMPNEAGHLPIDLAVQAECEDRILEVLRAADANREDLEPEPVPQPATSAYSPSYQDGYAFPEEEDMTFEDPRYFANQGKGPQAPPARNGYPHHEEDHYNSAGELPLTAYGSNRKPLYSIYSGAPHPGELQTKSLSLGDDRYRSAHNLGAPSVVSDEPYPPLRHEAVSDSHVLHSNKWQPKGQVAKATAFPPRWKQSRSCHVCASRFTLTRRRHHCRNCGFSVCSQHSTNRVPLPKFDLMEPQRLCDKCFLAGRHVFADGASSIAGGDHGSERHYEQPHHQYGRGDSFGSFRP